MFICFINVFITRTILCRGACMLICIMCMFPNVRLDIYYESNEIHCLLMFKTQKYFTGESGTYLAGEFMFIR